MKKAILLTLFSLFAIFAIIKVGETKTKSYYSGDAISYNNQVYVGSTDSGYLEVFKLSGNELENIARMKHYNGRFGTYENFSDLEFNIENGTLYVYSISNYTIYKYKVSGVKLELADEDTNTYWEWYNRIERFGTEIATISAKGVKVWNNDLQVISSYTISNEKSPYSINSDSDRFITNIASGSLEIFDREMNKTVSKTALNFKEINNHKTYQDENGYVYVVDDYYAKKFSTDGRLIGSFRHLDQPGFDVDGTNNSYIYFSNGMGVVKLNKDDMSLADYSYTYKLGGQGGWAMGLETVNAGGKDFVVVFNNTNILVLDSKLEKVASLSASEKEESYALENLFLGLDYYKGTKGASIEINGGGYLPGEMLSIDFAGAKSLTKADSKGRFKTTIVVPDKKGVVDIKVDGQSSKLSYSISFDIKEGVK